VLKDKPSQALAMEGNWKPNTGYNLLEESAQPVTVRGGAGRLGGR
jgi:hypothetical protein